MAKKSKIGETKRANTETPTRVSETKPPDTETSHPIAENLLIPLWRGIAKAYKMKYARSIWDQFQDGIQSAANNTNMGRFMTDFCRRMQCDLLTDDVATVAQFLQAADERKLLKSLREETTYLVLLVRVANEARKEEWKKELEERNADA